jgi:YVTN family beta-propeller protein
VFLLLAPGRRCGVLAAGVLLAALAGCGSSRTDPATTTVAGGAAHPAAARRKPATVPVTLVARPAAGLPAGIQDAAASPWHGGILLVGGLTPADVSSPAVVLVRRGRAVASGQLPQALHDAAAVPLRGAVYFFGGGDGVAQHDEIQRVAPGRATTVAHLPAPSSDQAAAALGGTAYVVGGFTGTRWLDTIVAWKPGSTARVVGHLPTPLRYAAVAAVDGVVVVAGGSTPAGTASTAVLAFDPATGRVRRIGTLPAPTTHAAAAALDGRVYVIGGRGTTVGTPSDRIVAVDPRSRRISSAGRLPAALSDLAAAPVGRGILVAGGRGAQTVTSVTMLTPGHPRAGAAAAIPKLLDAHNVYAADAPGDLTGPARYALPRIYVPNSLSNTVDVIDPATFKVVDQFTVGALPQHVVPAYDLALLYVTNDAANSLTVINPRTARPVRTIPVDDPYNMYFTPNGRYAMVVAERLQRLDFRDAHSFALVKSVTTPCLGVDHMDFTADGRFLLASCEFSGQMVVVNVARERVVQTVDLPGGSGDMPQDVKLSPDGRIFYVADMHANGVWEIDARSFRVLRFLATGAGAHGLYPSRDGKDLYVTNRGEGSVSVISFRSRKPVAKWRIPGGSPDMGGVSADGKVLWLSGRYNAEVYAISTRTGRLLARIPVGAGPHGLCVWPQPGRYSLGHTGILR